MRLIFSLLTTIVVIIAAIFFVGPLFISADDVRNQLFAQIETATGYRLRMSGPVDITLFPSFHLVAEDVGIAQPTTRGDTEFVTAKQLKFGLMLKGLLDGKMRMTGVALIDPVITVPNVPTKPVVEEQAPNETRTRKPGGGSAPEIAAQLRSLSLDRLVIENGTVFLPPSGQMGGKRIERLNLAASLPGFEAPLEFDAAAIVDGKAIEAAGLIGNFGRFVEGSPAPMSLQGKAPTYFEGKATLSGTATYKDNAFALSHFRAEAGDQTLTGTAYYKDETLTLSEFTATAGPYSLGGNASYSNNEVTINPLRATVQGTPFAGWITADLSNQVPYVVASLAAKTVDINALMGVAKSKPSGGGTITNVGSDTSGDHNGSAWSNSPIDFSPLKSINGKFGLSAEEINYANIKIKPGKVQAILSAGKLEATVADFNLYGGTGKAAIAVDASGRTPAQSLKVSLVKFDAYPFLLDAANFQSIEGKGTITLDLSATGASQSAIVSALGGSAKLEFVDGAIRGINVAKMLRNLGTGIVEGWQGGEAEKTDFASLGGSFKVAQGKATTDDLHLVGPLVRMTGAGTVDLPVKQLNFRVDPRLVASLEGQGGKQDLAGLGVPIMISGLWGTPKIYPGIKGILENPTAAYEQLRQLSASVVKLPGMDKLDKTGALPSVIQGGKVNKDALIQGLGGLLNKNQPAAVQPEPAPTPATAPVSQATPGAPEVQPETETTSGTDDSTAAATKTSKSKKKIDGGDVGRQLLQNFLGGQ